MLWPCGLLLVVRLDLKMQDLLFGLADFARGR